MFLFFLFDFSFLTFSSCGLWLTFFDVFLTFQFDFF